MDRRVTCSRCRAETPAKIALGAHASRLPEVRDAVLGRRFHQVRCAGCATTISIVTSFVYTDFGRDQWILVGDPRDLGAWTEWETRLERDVRQIFERGSPLAHAIAERLRMRVVFGYEELREKLILWDAGHDDRIVECVKLTAIAADPRLAAAGSRLLVGNCFDDTFEVNWFARATDPAPARSLTTPGAWLRAAEQDRETLAARFPELFANSFASITRYDSLS